MSALRIAGASLLLTSSIAFCIYAIKKGNFKQALISLCTSIVSFLFLLLGIKSKQNDKLKKQVDTLKQQNADLSNKISNIATLQQELQEIENGVKYETFKVPNNATERLNRLNSLHELNSTEK